ncbi:hypothetical protein DIZ76_016879 [Coccidioides immitis]|nr:hypothetical protein DIZ76_016879 [Coccidioides immitis]
MRRHTPHQVLRQSSSTIPDKTHKISRGTYIQFTKLDISVLWTFSSIGYFARLYTAISLETHVDVFELSETDLVENWREALPGVESRSDENGVESGDCVVVRVGGKSERKVENVAKDRDRAGWNGDRVKRDSSACGGDRGLTIKLFEKSGPQFVW